MQAEMSEAQAAGDAAEVADLQAEMAEMGMAPAGAPAAAPVPAPAPGETGGWPNSQLAACLASAGCVGGRGDAACLPAEKPASPPLASRLERCPVCLASDPSHMRSCLLPRTPAPPAPPAAEAALLDMAADMMMPKRRLSQAEPVDPAELQADLADAQQDLAEAQAAGDAAEIADAQTAVTEAQQAIAAAAPAAAPVTAPVEAPAAAPLASELIDAVAAPAPAPGELRVRRTTKAPPLACFLAARASWIASGMPA